MSISEQDLFGDVTAEIVTVTPPGATKPVYLRCPSFDEWHALAVAHQQIDTGKTPDKTLIAKTVATCLSTEDGKPLPENAVSVLLKSNQRRVMWLYRKCWETVLRSDSETIKELEKN